jgi:hypothetical protein
MPAAHTANFLNLINTALEDISRGVASPHHLHNIRCGIENILSLLKYNNEVVEKADQFSRRAYDYVTYHDLKRFSADLNRWDSHRARNE